MTTIVSVRRNGTVAVGGDGQVTMGQSSILKDNARKVRRLFKGRVIAGFAGSTADAFTLLDLFEKKLEAHQGILERACVALVKDWRTDKMLRKLEAIMIVADKEHSFRHRFRRQLRLIGGTRLSAQHRFTGRGDRQKVLRDRRRNLRLHQSKPHHRDY